MKKLILILSLFPIVLFGQELDATVTVNYEQLETSAKEKLENFADDVREYLNSNRFTDQDYQDKIKCSFNIFFVSSSGETKYSAQVVITSQRPIYNSQKNSLMFRVQDSKWDFNYEKGQTLYFNQTDFDPLTSFLDYYAYVIIGVDADSYQKLGGTDYFNKALDITVLGGNSSYKKGWVLDGSNYNRRALVLNLTDASYQKFREDFFDYHYNGIDIYAENKTVAQRNIVKLISDLAAVRDKLDARSVLLKVFFDAKNKEIVDYLMDYPDKATVFEMLKKIDPSHLSTYEKLVGLN